MFTSGRYGDPPPLHKNKMLVIVSQFQFLILLNNKFKQKKLHFVFI